MCFFQYTQFFIAIIPGNKFIIEPNCQSPNTQAVLIPHFFQPFVTKRNIYHKPWTLFHCVIAHLLGIQLHRDKFQQVWVLMGCFGAHLFGFRVPESKFQQLRFFLHSVVAQFEFNYFLFLSYCTFLQSYTNQKQFLISTMTY